MGRSLKGGVEASPRGVLQGTCATSQGMGSVGYPAFGAPNLCDLALCSFDGVTL